MKKDDQEVDLLGLNLQIGSAMNLEFLQPSIRTASVLIGCFPGKSIIVSTPVENRNPIILKEGRPVVVRFLVNQTMIGFSSSVIRSCLLPFAYLHLEYPRSLSRTVVRNARRVTVSLITSILNKDLGSENSGIITDISKTGCQITAAELLGETKQQVKTGFRVKISGKEQLLDVQAVIRSVRQDRKSGDSIHGLEFIDLEERSVQILNAFINQELARG